MNERRRLLLPLAAFVLIAALGGFTGCPSSPPQTTGPVATVPLQASVTGLTARALDPDQEDRATGSSQPVRPLRKSDTVVVSFAEPMVPAASLDQPAAELPVALTPALPVRSRWRSPTELELTVAAEPAPATRYQLLLRSGLRDLAGRPVSAASWGLQWPEALFLVRQPWSPYSGTIPAQPSLTLEFSHAVAAAEVARTVVWRDETGRTTPCEVTLGPSHDDQRGTRFTVSPAKPLPTGHRYELLVEGTRCAIDGSRLAYVHVFPVGRTDPLHIESVAGYNQPVLGPFLELRFNQPLDAAALSLRQFVITPAVAHLRLESEWGAVRLFGDFDPALRYRVEIATGVRSRRGFLLEQAENWHAHFRDKRPAVIIPRSVVTTSARQGLTLDLVQVNTAPLHWRLARVPIDSMQAVRTRLDEYRTIDDTRRQPATGENPLAQTELLVPALHLPVVAEGDFDAATADREVPRNVSFAPDRLPEGIYLFEIAGSTADSRLAGNRVLVLMNREFFVWKTTADGLLARLFDIVTGDPVPQADIQLLAANGKQLGRATTDATGQAQLPDTQADDGPALVVVRRGDSVSAHFVDLGGGLPSRHHRYYFEDDREGGDDSTVSPEPLRQWLFSDRGIYRPGETLRVKGIVRTVRDGQLALPESGRSVVWQLVRIARNESVLTGETSLNELGGWEEAIALPATLPIGNYELRALGASCPVKIDEFRAPPFAAEAASLAATDPTESRVRVLSRYFHGAPNARAAVRWRAVWTSFTPNSASPDEDSDRWFSTGDWCSPERELTRPRWTADSAEENRGEDETVSRVFEGTALLDADGVAELSSHQPFPAAHRLAAAHVTWEISVVAPDGQTVAIEDDRVVPVAPAQPAVALSAGKDTASVDLDATALSLDGQPLAGIALQVELYHVAEKSVREHVSRRVVRYRNTPLFTKVATRTVAAPFRETIPVAETGRYVAVVSLSGVANSPRASTDTSVSGAAPAEFAQWDDSTFAATPDRTEYNVGDTAHIALRAPFAGQAWVTVESDHMLFSNLVRLPGNAANVDVPISPAMHPNAHVEIYLFRPESLGAPAERLAHCQLRVRRPETELRVVATVAAAKVEPGQPIQGEVAVTALGQPAADAEVTLFAVDEAVLRYGGWQLGDAADVFFPAINHQMETRSSLRQFGSRPPDAPLFQKGFIIGDGAGRPTAIRRRFAALAFWQGSRQTDAAGRATFAFTAPDNLTAYRIVAVAHHGTEQFGHGEKLVEVARRLQAEPALPRFVRQGDTTDLRVLLRQNEWPTLPVRATCTTDGAVLQGATVQDYELRRALPDPAIFPAVVSPEATQLAVRFGVASPREPLATDAVELSLPVKPARIVRREACIGTVPANGLVPPSAVPAEWRRAAGTADLLVSTSPWLPVCDALPRLLDYPHGCDEQISARVLAYALMADLLDGLPDSAARQPEYRKRIETGLAILARAQLPEGDMPYWPGTKVANPFVTIQTAWAVAEAERSGFRVSPLLRDGLQTALRRIARRGERMRVEPTLRAFALMVSATLEPGRKLRAEALDLHQQRDALDDDGRAFLALALHRYGIMPDERKQFVAELGADDPDELFAPSTLRSAARTTALRLLARLEIGGATQTADEKEELRQRFRILLDRSPTFSTQENLWLLLAFRAFLRDESGERLALVAADSPRLQRSADGRSAGWYGVPLPELPALLSRQSATNLAGGSFLLRAAYRLPEPERREDRGFRLERVVRNLTEPKRDGTPAAPFSLGDELLVTFRVMTERSHAYVALDESLPAAFETVDPEYLRLSLREKLAELATENRAALSHWEKRDDRTLWYFDDVAAGTLAYSVVVRVTASGRYQWPGATIAPMYDWRFSGTSEGTTIEVR
ncbi:MAG TPA: alpha-2-macroglobulin family protein [Opitutaceae bacterium]|nr:alpha-2-macroglobulin family protein [Opitutaceae bacterium]